MSWRGLISQSTDVDALRTAFESSQVTFYCGFDPTAPSLHVGHLVQLITMRRLQRSEEHTSELQSRGQLVCRLLLEKKKLATPTSPRPLVRTALHKSSYAC